MTAAADHWARGGGCKQQLWMYVKVRGAASGSSTPRVFPPFPRQLTLSKHKAPLGPGASESVTAPCAASSFVRPYVLRTAICSRDARLQGGGFRAPMQVRCCCGVCDFVGNGEPLGACRGRPIKVGQPLRARGPKTRSRGPASSRQRFTAVCRIAYWSRRSTRTGQDYM